MEQKPVVSYQGLPRKEDVATYLRRTAKRNRILKWIAALALISLMAFLVYAYIAGQMWGPSQS